MDYVCIVDDERGHFGNSRSFRGDVECSAKRKTLHKMRAEQRLTLPNIGDKIPLVKNQQVKKLVRGHSRP